MEIVIIAGAIIAALMCIALVLALRSEKKVGKDKYLAEIEHERAKTERARTEMKIKEAEFDAANKRALILSQARDNALAQILSADLQSKNDLLLKIGERGGLKIEFSDGDNSEDKGNPKISWEWVPFQNAVIKIYRNEGSILEDINAVMDKAQLIHVEQHKAQGHYYDKETKANHTYNYYAFIETRRTGIKAEPVTLDLPDEVKAGRVIDASGNEITSFQTVQPTSFEEPLYDGFCYRRLTVSKWLDGRAQRKEELAVRREELQIKEEEFELEALEKQIGLRSGNFDTDHIKLLIAEATEIASRGSVIDKATKMLDEDNSLDDRQREIILAFIKKQSYQ